MNSRKGAATLIISNEQIERALAYLRSHRGGPVAIRASVTPEQVERIKNHLRDLPDVREPMVSDLRKRLPIYVVDPGIVADKMVGRVIGDKIR